MSGGPQIYPMSKANKHRVKRMFAISRIAKAFREYDEQQREVYWALERGGAEQDAMWETLAVIALEALEAMDAGISERGGLVDELEQKIREAIAAGLWKMSQQGTGFNRHKNAEIIDAIAPEVIQAARLYGASDDQQGGTDA